MQSFKQFFSEAITKDKLFANTDDGRLLRAKTVKTRRSPLSITASRPELKRTDYIIKSKPSIEKKTHWGYVDHDGAGEIHQMYCSCKDFNYRLYYPMVKADLAVWDLEAKYAKKSPFKHNTDPSVITNPDNRIYLCKHLTMIMQRYIPG